MAPIHLSPDLLPEVRVRAAGAEDISFIADMETSPEYIDSVYSWSPETHLGNLSNAGFRYFIALGDDDSPIGFAILSDLDDADKAVQLQRIIINARGHGLGRAFLYYVVDKAFGEYQAKRLWLTVFSGNEKAISAYRRLGLMEENVEKNALIHNGRSRNVTTMAILEDEWRDLNP